MQSRHIPSRINDERKPKYQQGVDPSPCEQRPERDFQLRDARRGKHIAAGNACLM